ncbi:SET domain-containing protein [Coniochaeta sp. 2T2.1]|nr:SET domain-containing protein [Coniochaeta sp. 2T2.1]
MSDIMAEAIHEPLSLPSDSSFFSSATPPTDVDASSNVASSMSSTPPTSVSPDNISIASEQGIEKLIDATASILQEPELLTEQRDNSKQPEQEQRENTPPMQLTEPRTEQITHLHAVEPSDPDSQLQRELEAQNPAESELEAVEVTPAASAIIVAPRSQPASESPSTTPQRPRRARASLPVYNISKLAGTDIHGRRRAKGDDVKTKSKRRLSADDALAGNTAAASSTEKIANELVGDAINALNMDWSVGAPLTPAGAKVTRKKAGTVAEIKQEIVTRRTTRLSGTPVPSAVTSALLSVGKRGKRAAEEGLSKISLELKRLQDTKEFAHVDDRPIIETVWSNGKFVDPRTLKAPGSEPRASKRVKTAHTEPEAEVKAAAEAPAVEAPLVAVPEVELPQKKRITKKWLDKGLYAGQETPKDMSVGLTIAEKRKLQQHPELAKVGEKVNKTLPPPMFNGLRLLLQGRDFKLPYDICNPLPPGHPKPPAYRSMTKNRFVGDASAYWKKQPHLNDFQSRCVCKPEDGCAEDCQNRIMLYECDDTNCNLGKEFCQNRAFQSLQERTKQGGRFRVGVEVFKTEGKGYGVRSNRCFRPHQIIMEYTGEIITENECNRRMNEVYKDNECYYLMSFDQNMIIDATTGSIARFVNHSCSPNCRMIKWIVGGQPRMALFAGDRPIMTGEELTYDYNFDPFSAKNVQKCLCGAENCRGVLGPKPREVKAPKVVPELVKKGSSAKAIKRKLQELIDGDGDIDAAVKGSSPKSFKKRKMAVAKGVASSLSKAGLKVAKGAANALRRSASSISVSAKAALSSKKTSTPLRRVSTGGIVKKTSPRKATPSEKAKITTTKAALDALICAGTISVKKPAKVTSRSSSASLTIVAAAPKPKTKALTTTTGNAKSKVKTSPSSAKAKSSPFTKAKSSPKATLKKSKVSSKSTPLSSKSKKTATPKPSAKQQHSGYTPPSSPGPDPAPLKLSARKKVPTRKVLESKVAGTASVTKPKDNPKAKSTAKSTLQKASKRHGFFAALDGAIKKASHKQTTPAGRKGTKTTSATLTPTPSASATKTAAASADATPVIPPKSARRSKASTPVVVDTAKGKQQNKTKDNSPPAQGSIQAVAPPRPGFKPINRAAQVALAGDSPERVGREAMDVTRVDNRIRLVEG